MKTTKKPPVDRWKLLIGLGFCVDFDCDECPYKSDCAQQAVDALAYIGYLEELLVEVLGHDA